MKERTGKIIKRAVQVIVIGVIFYYLGRQLAVNWDKVVNYPWQINYFYLTLSVISVLITFFVISIIWAWIVATFGKKVSYAKAFKISYLSNLGRYIPGKVWQLFGFVYLAKKEGITESEALTAFGLALTFTLPPAFTSGLLFMAAGRGYFSHLLGGSFSWVYGAVFLILLIAANLVLIFCPRPVEWLINGLFRLLRRPTVKIEIHKALALKLYAGYFAAWSLYGFSFWLFLKGIMVQQAAALPLMGLFIIAYQIGYLALFAPGGVGPREVVMQVLLTPYFGPSVAAAIALASRLWLIIAEAISALVALKIK